MGENPPRRDGGDAGGGLEHFRPYLLVLARMSLRRELQGKCAPSDLVQQTLLEAHRGLGDRPGRTFGEQAAWLRKMLVHNAAKAARDLHRQKRDVRREVSLERALERSSLLLGNALAAKVLSPSEQVVHEEDVLRLAAAVHELPEPQQEAVLGHYVEGLSMSEIGERLGRTPAAAAGLLHRGLKRLRELLAERAARD